MVEILGYFIFSLPILGLFYVLLKDGAFCFVVGWGLAIVVPLFIGSRLFSGHWF